ncbi:hypothetical protein G4B88_022025 [Cannabis sativa]|uniref:beta-ketoacyl-[acyl-carrier-protein] synthase I n=1 Tax=Cannabis sativa TaxID=3483 RepID=A0A7J6EEM7_CANSA|nr:hypothetical protein G4B88_022025 [Cannabis sativa]
MMIAGGTEAAIIPIGLGGFVACRALSQRNDDPKTASCPWDKDQYLEGVVNCDAYHMINPRADGLGVSSCILSSLEDVGVSPEEVLSSSSMFVLPFIDVRDIGSFGGGEQLQGQGECDEKIFVYIRLRPLNQKEATRNDVSNWECINDTTIIYRNKLSVSERSMYPTAYTFGKGAFITTLPFCEISSVLSIKSVFLYLFLNWSNESTPHC